MEQSKGIESPRYAGYYHHRWLITSENGRLLFRHKPHFLHSVNKAIVAHVPADRRINPRHAIVTLDWTDRFEAIELLEFQEENVLRELCEFARNARTTPGLTVKLPMSPIQRIKRRYFYFRLRLGIGR